MLGCVLMSWTFYRQLFFDDEVKCSTIRTGTWQRTLPVTTAYSMTATAASSQYHIKPVLSG